MQRHRKSRASVADLKVASLFSGCGGFDLGFEAEGFRSVGAFDIDRNVVEAFNSNIRPVARVCDLAAEMPEVKVDVLLAGSPCQGFSTVGKRNLNDPRNDLLVRAGRIALKSRPRVFVLENVPAAIAGAHGTKWEQVESELRAASYRVTRFVADGATSGVAQKRKRLFLIAWDTNTEIDFSPKEVAPPSLSDILNVEEGTTGHNPTPLARGSREYLIARRIKPGQKLCNVRISPSAVHTWEIPEVFGETTSGEREVLLAVTRLRRRDRRRNFGDADPVLAASVASMLGRDASIDLESLIEKRYLRTVGQYVDLVHTYNGKFRRLPSEGLSPTVDTHFGNPSLFLHPKADRGMTPREAARIQGFPDSFKLTGSPASDMRMVGNAVPPPMSQRIARFLKESIFKG